MRICQNSFSQCASHFNLVFLPSRLREGVRGGGERPLFLHIDYFIVSLMCPISPPPGSVKVQEEGERGQLSSTAQSASWQFSVMPVYGWGSQGEKQNATAGWLAALPVFEPHWQV